MNRPSGTALLCLLTLCNTFSVGAFSPLLPEIARAQSLADWQLGIVAGAFGFARMAADVPTGALAGRWLGTTLALAPATLLAGLLVLGWAASFEMLVLGRVLVGLAQTLTMVAGLTAILQEDHGPSPSVRLNIFELAGMLGVLGGVAVVGLLPTRWGWGASLWVASAPLLAPLALLPLYRKSFPDRPHHADRATLTTDPAAPRLSPRTDPIVWVMFSVGTVIALSWASVSQFLIPLRGAREFGLDRAGVSWMLVLAQLVDLVALLPVGWLADRVGRVPVLGLVAAVLGLGTWGVGLGSLPLFVLGCALFGFGMAGWMLPLGVIREHTALSVLAWRTGLYRVGVDAAIFLGPLICGFLGPAHTGVFIGLVGTAALAAGLWLLWRELR